jgi:hypothetical protein
VRLKGTQRGSVCCFVKPFAGALCLLLALLVLLVWYLFSAISHVIGEIWFFFSVLKQAVNKIKQ